MYHRAATDWPQSISPSERNENRDNHLPGLRLWLRQCHSIRNDCLQRAWVKCGRGSMGRRLRATLLVIAMTPLAFALAVLGFFVIPWTVPVAYFRPPYRVEQWEGGRPVWDRSVVPGSPEERAISRWLQAHASGWRPTFHSYAPVQRIGGDGFRFNFQKGRCILNYRTKRAGAYFQVSRSIEDSDSIFRKLGTSDL